MQDRYKAVALSAREIANRPAPGLSRRRFVQGLMVGGVAIAGLDLWRWPALATQIAGPFPQLWGNKFDLVVERTPVNFTGRRSVATTVNGLVPGPTLRWREGDTVTISVSNHLSADTSIHWHGLRIPADMDGVPGLSFAGIRPGQTSIYRFPIRQHGTYWYHSHSHFQEQTGHYGALIIDPKGPDPIEYDREYVILLSDWSDQDPDIIFTNLKQQSDYYNYNQRTAGSFFSDARREGLGATLSDRLFWGRMNMSPADLSDVSGATYTYLLNGHPPAANWTALFKPRERVRLRFINGSSMTIFDVRIPNLPMTVVQADGNDVEPVVVDEFRISVAETYDVIVQPQAASAFTIFAQSIDRSGYARATLAAVPGMTVAVPPMDPRPELTMVDMGMAETAGMENSPAMKMSDHPETGQRHAMAMGDMEGSEMREMPSSEMAAAPSTPPSATPRLVHYSAPPAGQPGPGVIPIMAQPASSPVSPIATEAFQLRKGPQVDNVAAYPTERLDQPGLGLNNNGRRVLTYAELRGRWPGTDRRAPSREIELHLTGNMERFIWGFDGRKFSAAEPIRLQLGERVRIILVNDSMMNHPIHLHGLWSELENGQGEFRPYKHTINVKPGERLSYLVSADTPGEWAYHCHLLYHMEAGMFRKVIVS
ncbi:MAG TPA: copper resistance system multicopper oxidase [Candidatus Binataceae bacterium]|nr:copper resistance system multicopper oxidase [Candidatus Binataceae bacterium]